MEKYRPCWSFSVVEELMLHSTMRYLPNYDDILQTEDFPCIHCIKSITQIDFVQCLQTIRYKYQLSLNSVGLKSRVKCSYWELNKKLCLIAVCLYWCFNTMVCWSINTSMLHAGTNISGLFDVCRIKQVGTKAACYKNPYNTGLIDQHWLPSVIIAVILAADLVTSTLGGLTCICISVNLKHWSRAGLTVSCTKSMCSSTTNSTICWQFLQSFAIQTLASQSSSQPTMPFQLHR